MYIHTLLLCYLTRIFASVNFYWLEYDNRFDCIVGITAEDRPVGIGTFIFNNLIVTSANPLEQYLKKKGSNDTEYYDPDKKIKVKVIKDRWNSSRTLSIEGFTANLSKRSRVWIKMGFDKTHSPIHDLIYIRVQKNQVKKPPVTERAAFYLHAQFKSYFRSGWTVAGFGYVDNHHVSNNTILEMSVYEDSAEVDCDEWIPRAWGRFICLLKNEDVLGVQSGAPLFWNSTLRGVGSFALQKGKESILVFTDFSLYRELLYDGEATTTTKAPNLLRIDHDRSSVRYRG